MTNKSLLSEIEHTSLKKYVRATDFLAAAQIYLKSLKNLEQGKSLTSKDIKPRLLGHWGSCPGINFVNAHINRLICKHKKPFLYLVGPGHGFPAMQANLFVEKSLTKYYPEKIPYNRAGVEEICSKFSAPYGYPSHSNPAAPGAILEGGELGYSLSVAFGSVLDRPDLITCCLVGDGESETGPLAAAWHVNKLLSPKENGAVLPIVHVNGYKISGPTFLGRMSDEEAVNLFKGLGYDPYIVSEYEDPDFIHHKMAWTMDKAYAQIRDLQKRARSGEDVEKPKWPMIILRTPKGWTGINHDEKTQYENNCLSHQVVFPDVKTNDQHREMLEEWLKSYNFWDLIEKKTENKEWQFVPEIQSLIPPKDLALGSQKYALGGEVLEALDLPNPEKLAHKISGHGQCGSKSMHQVGEYFRQILKKNKSNNNFRIFSPDETYSNKIHAVFEETKRSWQWPNGPYDTDFGREGKVMEMLSEHTLFGMLHGYTATGRFGAFVSYEAFVQVIASMADQYAKFLAASQEVDWRKPLPGLNIFLTSLLERQDHNGFSHQNPSFISSMMEKDGNIISAYLPPDSNSMIMTLDEIFKSRDKINLVIAGKKTQSHWLTLEQAKIQMRDGIMTWNFASDKDPQVVMVASGDYIAKEAVAARQTLKEVLPSLRVRVVYVSELTALGVGDPTVRSSNEILDQYFTSDKGVVYGFHGYPQTIKKLLFDYSGSNRIEVHGYHESGSTTTPFDMKTRNQVSRFGFALSLAKKVFENGEISEADYLKVKQVMTDKLKYHHEYILEHGEDPAEIRDWSFKEI